MIEYIINDMVSVLRYLPYGLVVGIIVAIVFSGINKNKIRKGKKPISVAAVTAFFMYTAIVLVITFWSREEGSRNVKIDLKLFSSWGINDRNNAFMVENVLLFVPYGFVCAWFLSAARKFGVCTVLGLCTSVAIECLQLVTGRGFFQIDDILTNVIGTVIGYILFRCFWKSEEKGGKRARAFYRIMTGLSMIILGFGVIASSGEGILHSMLENPLLREAAHASQYAALTVVFGFGCQTIRQGRGRAVNFFCAVLLCVLISIGDFLQHKYVFLQQEDMRYILLSICGAVVGGGIYLALGRLQDALSNNGQAEP